MIHVGTFPSTWTVAPDDLHYSDAQGREFAITCHVTPGMGSEVAVLKKAGGQWQFSKYLDDYVDGNFAHHGNDMTNYLAWLCGQLNAWLAEAFPAGAVPPPAGDPGVGEPIERVHASLGLIKIKTNSDGTLSASI